MKTTLLMTICLLVVLLQGCSYLTISSNSNTLGIETGKVENNQLFGVGILYAQHDDSYEGFTEVKRGNELSVYGKYGIELIRNGGLFLSAFGGVSFCEETKVISFYHQDDYSYYDEKEGYVLYPIFGIGVSYVQKDGVVISIDHSNRHGTTFGLGWRF